MQITKETKPEDIQRFMRRHRLTETYECAGFLFRVKAHAESHSRQNKNAEIKVHTKEVPAEEKKSAKEVK